MTYTQKNACRYCKEPSHGMYHMRCWMNYLELKREARQIHLDMVFYRNFSRLPTDPKPMPHIAKLSDKTTN